MATAWSMVATYWLKLTAFWAAEQLACLLARQRCGAHEHTLTHDTNPAAEWMGAHPHGAKVSHPPSLVLFTSNDISATLKPTDPSFNGVSSDVSRRFQEAVHGGVSSDVSRRFQEAVHGGASGKAGTFVYALGCDVRASLRRTLTGFHSHTLTRPSLQASSAVTVSS
jgi:hypothetical protein